MALMNEKVRLTKGRPSVKKISYILWRTLWNADRPLVSLAV
jgi:hypothetical protein